MRRSLSHSAMASWRACQRKFDISRNGNWEPVRSSAPLRVGRAFHTCVEMLWRSKADGLEWDVPTVEPIVDMIREQLGEEDQGMFMALVTGYVQAWRPLLADWDVVGVELEFTFPILNPATWKSSRSWSGYHGFVDLVLRNKSTLKLWVVEHKTSSEDLTPGSSYWEKLAMDYQLSGYLIGAESLGMEVEGLLYDVMRKPRLRQKKTESPDEFGARLVGEITENLTAYHHLQEVARDESQIREFMRDVWGQAQLMRRDHYPRNPDACHQIGRSRCEFWQVCALGVDPAESAYYQQREKR